MGSLGPNPTPSHLSYNINHGRSSSMNAPATVPHQSHTDFSQHLNSRSSPGADTSHDTVRPALQDGFRRLNTGVTGQEGNYVPNNNSFGSPLLPNPASLGMLNNSTYIFNGYQNNDAGRGSSSDPLRHKETNHDDDDDDDPNGRGYGDNQGSRADDDEDRDDDIQDGK